VPSLISIDGIRADGRHGANPGEQSHAQEFLVDVEVWVEVERDSLTATVDYRTIVDTVRETVGGTSFHLLESLAEAVATALIESDLVLRASAVVHKPGAAASLGVADVSAEVTLDEP
jgi:dihydroneopterin aldolase